MSVRTTSVLAAFAMGVALLFGFRQSSLGATESSPVAVLVEVPIPPGVGRSQIEAAMAKTVPTYQSAPGLIRKYFIISEDDNKLGGIYLWENRKVAEAWYNESVVWHAGVSKNSGLKAKLTYFDVPLVTEGPASYQK